jgi:3-methyladenine DNA glycosylase AlkD
MDRHEPPLASTILEGLLRHADPTRAANERAYLKSEREFLGVTVPEGRKVVRAVLADAGPLTVAQLEDVAIELWNGPVFEARRAATDLLVARASALGPDDLGFVEGLIRDGETWALVDPLAASVAGTIVAGHPGDETVGSTLDRWAADADSFWVRRASLLALMLTLRHDDREWARFGRYADSMLAEREFFVRKAIGWVLRDISKQRPDQVRAWVEPRLEEMSGVTRREAVKYL